jgi:protein-L-isoaspartate O-methyltransferase
VEALDLTPSTALSFLNIGSGTGYLSCIVAHILGPTSVCYGVELQKEAVDHCGASLERWKSSHDVKLPHMEFIHGNGLEIDSSTGESAIGYDRIYVGASLGRAQLKKVASLLRAKGVMVAPGAFACISNWIS